VKLARGQALKEGGRAMIERTVTGWLSTALAAAGACLGAAGCSSSSSASASPGGNEAAAATNDAAVAITVDASVDDDAAASSDDASAASSCQTGGLPTDTYAANLMKVGRPASGGAAGDASSSGGLTFVLTGNTVAGAASPPLEPYTNIFTLKLLDASGQPVTDATVTLPTNNQALGWPYSKDPWMPLHQHGASIIPTVTNNGDGTYAISTYFFMPGLWQIYLVAQTPSLTDSAEYAFCLQ
jgi:hypothetical protein